MLGVIGLRPESGECKECDEAGSRGAETASRTLDRASNQGKSRGDGAVTRAETRTGDRRGGCGAGDATGWPEISCWLTLTACGKTRCQRTACGLAGERKEYRAHNRIGQGGASEQST